MARKAKTLAAEPPFAHVIAYRPNGVEYSRVAVDGYSAADSAVRDAWRTITTDLGWMPVIRVIRARDNADITAFIR